MPTWSRCTRRPGLAAFLGVQAGDHLIYIAEAGSDHVAGFEARSNIRRTLLVTAGGKALLAARSEAERESYLRRRSAERSRSGRPVPRGVRHDQADAHRDERSPQGHTIRDRDDRSQPVRRGGRVDHARRSDARCEAPRRGAGRAPDSARRLAVATVDHAARSDLTIPRRWRTVILGPAARTSSRCAPYA